MKIMKITPRQGSGFTLIELLTVVAIIAILIGLLFPAIKNSISKAERTQAAGDVRALELAIRGYNMEYGKLPVANADQGVADKTYSNATQQVDIIYTLISSNAGANASYALNPRRIIFLDLPSRKNSFSASTGFVDPWGKPYLIRLDNNYDGSIATTYTAGGNYLGLALIASGGPNGTIEESTANTDDIVNCK